MTPPGPRRLLAVLCVPLALAGCSLLVAEAPERSIPVRELAVPAALTRSTPSVSYGRMLPASSARPALIAGRSSLAGGPDRPTLWRSTSGTSWEGVPLAVPEGAELVDLVAGGDDTAVVLAGSWWHDGERTAWASRSEDGRTWSTVELPDGIPANPAVLGAVVLGGDPALLVADASGGWHVARTGEGAGVVALPAVPEDVERSGLVADAVGERIVVLATHAADDATSRPVAYVSSDAGRSWDDPVPVAGPTFGASGIASAGEEFVAIGWERATPEARLRPASWHSADGTAWTPEPVALVDWITETTQDSDLTLTALRDGFAVLTLDEDPYVVVMRRDAAGGWSVVDLSGRTDSLSPSGVVGAVDDRAVLAMSGRDAGVIGSMSDSGAWVEHADHGDPVDRPQPWHTVPSPDGPVLSMATEQQEISEGHIARWSREQRFALTEKGVGEVVPWPWPSHLGEPRRVIDAVDDETGAGVALVPAEAGTDPTTWTAWSSPGDDAAPVSSTLPTDGGDWVVDVTASAAGWVAVGGTQPDLGFGTRAAPAAWTSPDGTTWARAALPGPAGVVDGRLSAVCAAPDGTALAVGSASAGGTTVPLAFRRGVDGAWAALETDDVGARGSLDDCTSTPDGVAVLGSGGGRDQVWEVGADGVLTSVRTAPQGSEISGVLQTRAGLAVVGTARENDWAGGVLDVRTGAGGWTRVRVPVRSSWAVAAVVGDQVHTYWSTTAGVRAYAVELADLDGT